MAHSRLLLQANGMIMSVLLHSLIDIDRCMVSQAVVDSFLSSGPFLITVRNENLAAFYFSWKTYYVVEKVDFFFFLHTQETIFLRGTQTQKRPLPTFYTC